MSKKVLVQYNGTECPFCRCTDIDAYDINVSTDAVHVDYVCGECGKQWLAIFNLVSSYEVVV